MFRVGPYARVSTNYQQTLAMQNRAVREYAMPRGSRSDSCFRRGASPGTVFCPLRKGESIEAVRMATEYACQRDALLQEPHTAGGAVWTKEIEQAIDRFDVGSCIRFLALDQE